MKIEKLKEMFLTTPEVFRERMKTAFEENTGRWPIEHGISLGLAHHFTHDPDCAEMFKDALFYYEDLVRGRSGAGVTPILIII